MKLSDEDRNTMVSLERRKAHQFMEQAEAMLAQSMWDIAANRFYYACFHAIQALFIHNGLSSRRHAGMLSQFGLHFIKTGTINDNLGGFLTRMEQLRERGDYNCVYEVTEEEVRTMQAPAHELVECIEQLLSQAPTVG